MQKSLFLSIALVSTLSLAAIVADYGYSPFDAKAAMLAASQAFLEETTGLHRANLTDRSARVGLNLNNARKLALSCHFLEPDITSLIITDASGIAIKSDGSLITLQEVEAARLQSIQQKLSCEELQFRRCKLFEEFFEAQAKAIRALVQHILEEQQQKIPVTA